MTVISYTEFWRRRATHDAGARPPMAVTGALSPLGGPRRVLTARQIAHRLRMLNAIREQIEVPSQHTPDAADSRRADLLAK